MVYVTKQDLVKFQTLINPGPTATVRWFSKAQM